MTAVLANILKEGRIRFQITANDVLSLPFSEVIFA